MQALRSILRTVYGLYALVTFLILGLTAVLLALALPAVHHRRAAARAAARAVLYLVGMPVKLIAAEHLPKSQCVVVSNHASYLDGIVYTAALPARFTFVIKREMARVPLAGLMLRRLGSQFVERHEAKQGAADARRVLREAQSGHSLVFFPEGTFTPEPGLLRFHTGAFATAVRAGCPVVPAVIRGTRRALSPRGELPRLSHIEIEILPALTLPEDALGRDPAVELRERARAAILARLGEPDLTCSGDTALPPGTEPARSAPETST
jgi:1-acyl-sn-glycerol-3-phosphate acyltransferase